MSLDSDRRRLLELLRTLSFERRKVVLASEALAESGEEIANATPVATKPAQPPITQNANALASQNDNSGLAPVVNNSRHMLELSPPE